jgi:hypothetical protein
MDGREHDGMVEGHLLRRGGKHSSGMPATGRDSISWLFLGGIAVVITFLNAWSPGKDSVMSWCLASQLFASFEFQSSFFSHFASPQGAIAAAQSMSASPGRIMSVTRAIGISDDLFRAAFIEIDELRRLACSENEFRGSNMRQYNMHDCARAQYVVATIFLFDNSSNESDDFAGSPIDRQRKSKMHEY